MLAELNRAWEDPPFAALLGSERVALTDFQAGFDAWLRYSPRWQAALTTR
jgi:hypothetical protein